MEMEALSGRGVPRNAALRLDNAGGTLPECTHIPARVGLTQDTVVCKYSNEAQDAGRGGLGAGLCSQITTDVPGGLRVTDVDKLTSEGARGGAR